jgi:hypothetical protein
MLKISYDGRRFPPEIIRQAIWSMLTALAGLERARFP